MADHFLYHDGVYHAEGVSLETIARDIGTPFYCYSSATLKRHYEVFSSSLKGVNALVCFAVKANTARGVLATLAKVGAGADVVSEGEIRASLAAGVPASKIVFSGVAKTKAEMAYALQQGIFQFNVESVEELQTLSGVAAGMGKKARIAIRVNPDVDAKTHEKITTAKKESKFGIDMEQANEAYALAQTLPGIEVQGISVHIGSQLTSLEPFIQAFRHVKSFVQHLRSQGLRISTVDLGGGLGIPYGTESPPPPDDYGKMMAAEIGDLSDCQFIFEPGRLIAGNAGVLVASVIYVKKTPHRNFVFVDAGMNDLLRPAMYGAHHTIVPVKKDTTAERLIADIAGPICESSDIFARGQSLPPVQPGDLLAFRSAGAYGASMASTYNSRPLIAETMVLNSEYAVLRPRQTYEELFSRECLPAWLKN